MTLLPSLFLQGRRYSSSFHREINVDCIFSSSVGDCPDQYVYTKQPPAEIFVCNPYINRQLKMSCSVLGQNVTDIKWWFAPGFEEEDATILTNSSKHFLNRMLVAGGLEVQLTVRDLDDEDVGTYWCQASAIDSHGVQLLSTSEVVFLQAKDYFGDIPNSCNFFLMNAGTRCASILVTETVSVVPTTSPEPFTSSVSLTSQPTPTNLPSLFGTHPPSIPTAVVPPTWSILEGSSGILYAVLGLVGFLAIVCISLTVIVVVLCRRRCAKAEIKGEDSVLHDWSYVWVHPHFVL